MTSVSILGGRTDARTHGNKKKNDSPLPNPTIAMLSTAARPDTTRGGWLGKLLRRLHVHLDFDIEAISPGPTSRSRVAMNSSHPSSLKEIPPTYALAVPYSFNRAQQDWTRCGTSVAARRVGVPGTIPMCRSPVALIISMHPSNLKEIPPLTSAKVESFI